MNGSVGVIVSVGDSHLQLSGLCTSVVVSVFVCLFVCLFVCYIHTVHTHVRLFVNQIYFFNACIYLQCEVSF